MVHDKLDLAKQHREAYAARKKPFLLTVEPALYLTTEGRGEPGGDSFQASVGSLYAAAYTLKFLSKAAGRDYGVCKLEAVWWADGFEDLDFTQAPRDEWRWRLQIRTPDFLGDGDLRAAAEKIRDRGKVENIDDVALGTFEEGRCVQMLHLGPYEDEERTVEQMRAFVTGEGLAFTGRHHEIYLSDPRRVEPEKLRTLLRIPVRSAES